MLQIVADVELIDRGDIEAEQMSVLPQGADGGGYTLLSPHSARYEGPDAVVDNKRMKDPCGGVVQQLRVIHDENAGRSTSDRLRDHPSQLRRVVDDRVDVSTVRQVPEHQTRRPTNTTHGDDRPAFSSFQSCHDRRLPGSGRADDRAPGRRRLGIEPDAHKRLPGAEVEVD